MSHTSTHRVKCTLQLTLSLKQTYIMENTIRVQDHPLVAAANRNVQTIAEYKYFEEKYWDIEDLYAEGITSSCSVSDLFDDEDTESILNDLPF